MSTDRVQKANKALQEAALIYAIEKTARGNNLSQYTISKEEKINDIIKGILNNVWVNETGHTLDVDVLDAMCENFQKSFKEHLA